MDYLEPWFAVNDLRLADELRRELPSGHILCGLAVAACARRQDPGLPTVCITGSKVRVRQEGRSPTAASKQVIRSR
jgi:hypothetical protein